MLSLDITKRLVLTKALYKNGVGQANLPVPYNAISVLSFHDAIEGLLILIAQKHNVRIDNLSFMNYWREIQKATKNEQVLPFQEEMRRLNECRRLLKHRGIIPSGIEIDRCKIYAEAFIKESVRSFFEIEFEGISLINLIDSPEAVSKLEEAESSFLDADYKKAIEASSGAFLLIMNWYSSMNSCNSFDSPFGFSKLSDFDTGNSLFGMDSSSSLVRLSNYIDNVNKSIKNLDEALRVITAGIDYEKYLAFRRVTPETVQYAGGRICHYWGSFDEHRIQPNQQNARFCIDFVIDAGVSLSLKERPFLLCGGV